MSTFLAFDFGQRRIGVAAGQSKTGTAQGVDTVSVHASGPDWAHITKLVDAWRPAALIVGLPLYLDSKESPASMQARRFGDDLGRRYNLCVHFVDERLTTDAADHDLRSAGVKGRRVRSIRDQVAAQYLLQTFLDQQLQSTVESNHP